MLGRHDEPRIPTGRPVRIRSGTPRLHYEAEILAVAAVKGQDAGLLPERRQIHRCAQLPSCADQAEIQEHGDAPSGGLRSRCSALPPHRVDAQQCHRREHHIPLPPL